MKLKVAICFGGCSSEYGVSLLSASSIINNIDKEKYDVILVGITKEGNYYLYDNDIEKIANDTWFDNNLKRITFSCNRVDHGIIVIDTKEIIPIDIVFPVLHGINGEDGRLQGLLELAGIPYVGCDMTSSALCMDKYLAYELIKSNNILVPKFYLFNKNADIKDIVSQINLTYPVFVKPVKAGSSIGITKVSKEEKIESAINEAFKYDDRILIEKMVDGIEVGCAIIGNENAVIGEVDEVNISDGFYDYNVKYNSKKSSIIMPARLDIKERDKIKNIALKIYRILNCKGLARVDLFYTKDKKIVFNEVNSIPGFTAHSRYPAMLQEVGYKFSDIIDELIKLGLEK